MTSRLVGTGLAASHAAADEGVESMRYLSLAVTAALASAAPAAAQDNSAPAAGEQPAGEEIVVEGRRDRGRQIDRFIDALTPAPRQGQLGRFEWSVCPMAMGFSEAQNALVAARMRKVAEAAAVPLGKADCRPNVFVFVTADKQAVIELLRKKYPLYFTGYDSREVRQLARSPRVSAWHVKGLLDEEGRPIPTDQADGYYVNQLTGVPSRMRPPTRPHFLASIVVVEMDSLVGLTLTQLADYAAMRAFARLDPERLNKVAAPTILTILDAPEGTAVPVTLTQWDFAFLRSLYGSDENRYAGQQRGEMKQLMRDELAKAQAKQ